MAAVAAVATGVSGFPFPRWGAVLSATKLNFTAASYQSLEGPGQSRQSRLQ